MNRSVSCGLLAASLFAMSAGLAVPSAEADDLLVHVNDGDVQGHLQGGAREFLGIPYAAPPVGPLRWKPPVAPAPWTGTLDAANYSQACPQNPRNASSGTRNGSEDCLYLNVWTPEPAPTTPLPVMFWIHGGGNTSGSTGELIAYPPYTGQRQYDGSRLASEHGVLVVSVNYRLGLLGFLGHPALAGENANWPYAGNQGLLDQNFALQWVGDNIAAFGGDPDNVTLFGESAGSWDTCAHVLSPLSRGLFHRAISESGGCSVGVATPEQALARANALATAVGCDGAPDLLACLRDVPVDAILDQQAASDESSGFGGGLGISVDGGFLPDSPRALFASGDFAQVPYILGTNTDEGTIFFIGATTPTTPEEYTATLFDRFGDYAPEIEALYPLSRFAGSPRDALIRITGDAALTCSTYDTARRVAAARRKAYVYHFARVLPLSTVSLLDLGAFHGSELGFVFGSLEPAPTPQDETLGASMRGLWTSFAAKGKPRVRGVTGWPRFNPKKWNMLHFDTRGIVKTSGYRKAECDFWTRYYEAVGS